MKTIVNGKVRNSRVVDATNTLMMLSIFVLVGSRVLAAGSSPDCKDPDLAKITKGTKIMLCDGTLSEGTLNNTRCSKDGELGCIATADFPAVDKSAVSSGAIESGVTMAGVAGTDQTQILAKCREGVRNDLYNSNGLPGNAASNSANGTDKFDWWDVVDDFGNGGAFPSAMTGSSDAWGSSYYCNGSQIEDVSGKTSWLQPSGKLNCSATTCTDAITFSKIFYEPYTGIYLTNVLISAAPVCATGNGCTNWSELVSGCENLNSGDGTSKWRLPTVKEWYLLYVAGIYGVNSSKFAGKLTDNFWTATNNSTNTSRAWRFRVVSNFPCPASMQLWTRNCGLLAV